MSPPGAGKADRILDETRFGDLLDLARLPYFEVREGRLVLADPALGEAIDTHTHIALSWGRPDLVDLWRGTPDTETYLPARGRPIDFDVYLNKCFSPEDLRRLEKDLVVDGFTSGGMRATHTIANLSRDMHELRITHAVLLAIDYPWPISQNAETWLAAARGRPDMIVFGSVHPYDLSIERRLAEQVRLGARGIKVHPAVQVVHPADRRAMRLYRLCGERKLPVFFHCGPVGIEPWLQRRLTQVRHYEAPIAENAGTTIVLGHTGALQMEEALALHKRFPNVWLEVSSQSLPNIRTILAEADPDRVMYGTDWPFYPQAIQLAKVLIATEGKPELRRKVLRGNAARLLGVPG